MGPTLNTQLNRQALQLRLVGSAPSQTPASTGVATSPLPVLRFGSFELRVTERVLLREGAPIVLRARSFDLLIALAERPSQLVTREQLLHLVWPGSVVEENNLSVQINALRKVLGKEILVTVPGRGYRFVAPILAEDRPGAQAPLRPEHLPFELRTNLPTVLAPLIGRSTDMTALGDLIDRQALVSILGAGGIGKTRLAQALLHARRERYEHGVCFVDLASLHSGSAVAGTIAAGLGLRLSESDANANHALARRMATLEVLIALDNAEHLIDAVAATVQTLLDAAPRVRLLVTSQARLALPSEWIYRLGPLAVADAGSTPEDALACGAVALFVTRAQAQDHRFELNEANVARVIELCRRLDGSALAIELAVSRLSLLGLPRLLQSLGQRLGLLTTGPRQSPARQRTLRAALEWSHGLLSANEQAVFRRLAVFTGSVSLALLQRVVTDQEGVQAEHLSISAWDGLDALDSLVDRSLVSLVQGPADAEPRYRLLDSPLALASEQLQQSGEQAWLRQRHAQGMLEVLQQAHDGLIAGRLRHDALTEVLAPDIENASAAVDWALQHDVPLAMKIAPLLSMALGRHRYSEATALWQQLEPLLDNPPEIPQADLARAFLYCAEHWQSSRVRHTHSRAERASALALATGQFELAYIALKMVAGGCWRLADQAGLDAAVEACAVLEQPHWSAYVRSHGAGAQAWQALLAGNYPQAIHWFAMQSELHRQAGLSDGGPICNIAGAQLSAGMPADAEATARKLVAQLVGSRDQHLMCFSLANLSAALLAQDRAAAAREVLRDWWPSALQFDQYPQWADDAALIAALEQRPQAALRMAAFADSGFAALGQPREAVDQQRLDRAAAMALARLEALGQSELVPLLRLEGSSLRVEQLPTAAFAQN